MLGEPEDVVHAVRVVDPLDVELRVVLEAKERLEDAGVADEERQHPEPRGLVHLLDDRSFDPLAGSRGEGGGETCARRRDGGPGGGKPHHGGGRDEALEDLLVLAGEGNRAHGDAVVVLELQSAHREVGGTRPHGTAVPDEEFVVHQMSADLVQGMGVTDEPVLADLLLGSRRLGVRHEASGVDGASVVGDHQVLPASRDAPQRGEDVRVAEVVDRAVERRLRLVDELDEASDETCVEAAPTGVQQDRQPS